MEDTNLNKNRKNNELPLVSILLAVYKSNEKWLIEQLISLNNQSYKNINLYIYDDCPNEPVNELLFKKYITKFNYKIIRGKTNLGSNKAFEKLTEIAGGDYFAYCDQDDIWEKNKIETLMELIRKDNANIAYSDMKVIDENSNVTANTLLEAKPRLKYIYGNNLFEKFFFKNCVSGCCMLIKSEIAKKAIPFSKVTIHDQWLCIIGSIYGNITFTKEPLVKYRIHSNNQTGSLRGIESKEDYYKFRINILKTRLEEIKKISNNIVLKNVKSFCEARMNKNLSKMFKYRYLNERETYFEIIIKYIPEWLFKKLIKRLK